MEISLQVVLASAISRRRGRRAMLPSSSMISQSRPAGIQPGRAAEVDHGLGVAGALQHAARLRLQREDVAGPRQVVRAAWPGR